MLSIKILFHYIVILRNLNVVYYLYDVVYDKAKIIVYFDKKQIFFIRANYVQKKSKNSTNNVFHFAKR